MGMINLAMAHKATSAVLFALMSMGNPTSAQVEFLNRFTETPVAVEEVTPATVQDVLLSVCETRGYDEDCAKTLFGMLWVESNNISTAIGDNGLARGYFQIHYKLHKISTTCAEDLVCSANWSLTYMESHGYPDTKTFAVQCHNTCYAKNGYAARAARATTNLWDTPLVITQAAQIQLAVK